MMLAANAGGHRALVRRALDGDESAIGDLLDRLTPVVQSCVARALLARRPMGGPPIRELVEDLTQEVFLALFQDDGKVLRSWDPELGLSLENFAGLVARRQVLSCLRTQRRNPWREDPTLVEKLDGPSLEKGPEQATASRELLRRLVVRLQEELTPLGWHLFELLFVHELEVSEVQERISMTSAAVYQWRRRLGERARRLRDELMSESSLDPRTTGGDA